MSKYIVFDVSHISRIRYGKAKPSNPIDFSNKICTYIFNKNKSSDDINNLSAIIGCKKSDLVNNKLCKNSLHTEFSLNSFSKTLERCIVILFLVVPKSSAINF